MVDPSDLFAVDDVAVVTKREVRPMVTTLAKLNRAIEKHYRLGAAAALLARGTRPATSGQPQAEDVSQAPTVRLVNVLIAGAVEDRASDIHIEPAPDCVRVRYRIDGVLHEARRLTRDAQASVVARLKVMADLDIAERRVPQDGRAQFWSAGRKVELRVTTLPTVLGEQLTIRLLEGEAPVLSIDELGFLPDGRERYERAFRRASGALLATGPTGSGKTTTLYSALSALNEESRKIITVEDPVEYQLAGIAQVQVNVRGLTFAHALRSILRSDPDIVLVGEIRDRETARIAIEASLTGHLILSSLHTDNAAAAPMRLIDIGVDPYLVGAALDAIVSQRLVRRVCEPCREISRPTAAEVELFGDAGVDPPMSLARAVGCSKCSSTGYRGRIAIHEVLEVTDEIESIVSARGSSEEIKRAAVSGGMKPLRTVGLTHAAAGITSIEEVLRVL